MSGPSPGSLRILISATHASVVGGIETYLREVIPAIQADGHSVGFLTSAPLDSHGQPIAPGGVPHWSLDGADVAAVFRTVAEWQPEVALVHGMRSPEHEAEVLVRWPAVLFAHGHNATCVSGSRTHQFPAPQPCDKQFGPGCLFHYLPRRCGGLNPLTALRLYSDTSRRHADLKRYEAVVVASRHMLNEYRRHGVAEEALHLAPLFPTAQAPDPHPPVRTRSDRVLYVGRLFREKGPHLLIDAVAEVQRRFGRALTVDIAGEGPERGRLERKAVHRGVRVEFHGWVNAGRRVELMRAADVLAVPSVCPETFGLVGVEAGCVGLPAVGFANGGIPDWLIPGVTGESAPGDRPKAMELADALARALADDAHLRALSSGAWVKAREFTAAGHVEKLVGILHRAADRSRGRA